MAQLIMPFTIVMYNLHNECNVPYASVCRHPLGDPSVEKQQRSQLELDSTANTCVK